MTELAIRTDSTDALDTYPDDPPAMGVTAVRDLVEWVEQAKAAFTLAQTLCKTSFVPKHFFGKPEDTAAAILTGYEMGLSPLSAVKAIFVIAGTPGMYAKAMVAVLQSKGHDVWVDEQSDERVVVSGRRKGSDRVHTTTWDRARVVKAKLQSNAKYQDTPQQMMVARGQAEICRQVAPDALHGIPYSVEEIEDFAARPIRAEVIGKTPVTTSEILGTSSAIDAEAVDGDDPAPTGAGLSDRAAKAIDTFAGRGISREQMEMQLGKPASGWDDDDLGALMLAYQAVLRGEEFTIAQAPPKPMTNRHRARMFALFSDRGLTDEDGQRAYMAEKLGREVESRGALSDDECLTVIGFLESWQAQDEPPAGGAE